MVWIILFAIAFGYFWTFSMARAASKRSRSEEYWEEEDSIAKCYSNISNNKAKH